MGNIWFPNKPPVQEDANDFSYKKWFQEMYRFAYGESRTVPVKTSSFNADEDFLYFCDATSGDITISLPPATTYSFKKYAIKKIDVSVNTIIVTANGTDTIDGAATFVITPQYGWVILFSDGQSTWHRISSSDAISVGGGGGGHIIKEEGTALAARKYLNFIGTTVTATDNSTNNSTDVTIVPPTLKTQIYTTGSGNWTRPTGVEAVWVELLGGGGGGQTTSGGGGGAGELCQGLMVPVSGSSIAYSVGTGGNAGIAGGETSFGVYKALGGQPGAGGVGGKGGGPNGGNPDAYGNGTSGTADSTFWFGGASGGNTGNPGGGAGGYLIGGASSGGGSSIYGPGNYGSGGNAAIAGIGGKIIIYYFG